MDLFSDDEPHLMGLELVREFDNLTKCFYTTFKEDMNEWTESSEFYVGIRSDVMTEETIIEVPDPTVRPTKSKRIKAKSNPSTALPDETIRTRTGGVNEDFSEDVIVSDENIKIVFQLPINNKKENIKLVASDDNSVKISYMNNEGKRRSRTVDIPYEIDFETAKATYKNGILEVKFNRR